MTEQLPAATAVRVVEETVQIDGVVELNETEPVPDPPLVVREPVPPTCKAGIGEILRVD